MTSCSGCYIFPTSDFHCQASTTRSSYFACSKALTFRTNPGWQTQRNRTIGAWIEITFGKYVTLSAVDVRHCYVGYWSSYNFKEIELKYKNGKTTATMANGVDPPYTRISFNPPVDTDRINITALSAYGTANTFKGFGDISFFTRSSCDPPTSGISYNTYCSNPERI